MTVPRLLPHHLEELRASGISDETIFTARLRSITNEEATALIGFGRSGALAFPYLHTAQDGGQPYTRVKFDKPGTKGGRYAQAKGSGNRLYIPSTLDPVALKDPARPLFVCEGEKKCLKANQEGLLTVSVSGVDSWRSRASGKSQPIADLDLIAWRGRSVFIVYDSDLVGNEQVRWAEFLLGQELTRRGAKVQAIRLPGGPNGEKIGLDDYLLTHSVDSFCEIEPVPVVHPEITPEPLPVHEPLEAFLSREIKTAPSIIGDGALVEKGLHLLVGPTKKGKTIFGVQLALTIAGGREYWLIPELLVHKASKVLYLNLEMPASVFEGRLQQQLRQARAGGYEVARAWGNFRHLTLRGKMRLDRKDGRELLVRLIRETGAKFVVVDNLGAAMAVDSNADERMAPIFLSLYQTCEEESVAILLVLHTPKELGDRDEVYWARGSSIQSDRADTIITMKVYGNDEQAIQRRIGLTLRCGPEVDPIIVSRPRGSLLWTAGKQKDVRRIWLREFIREERTLDRDKALAAFEAAGHGKEGVFKATLRGLAGEVAAKLEGFPATATLEWIGA